MSAPVTRPAPRVPWQIKFALLSLIWGASFLFMMVGLRALYPLQISSLRILAGSFVLLLVMAASKTKLPSHARTWGHIVITAALLCAIPFTLFAMGEERVTSGLAGIGNAVTPAATVVFTLLLLPAQRPAASQLLGVVGGFLGVVVIMAPWNSAAAPDALGFGMVLMAASCYGLGWVYTRRYLTSVDRGGLALPTAQLLVASVEVTAAEVVWWWLNRDHVAAPWSLHTTDVHQILVSLACVGTLGFIGTGLAQAMQYDVVREAGPTVATSVTYLIPVVSATLGIVFLGEHLTVGQVVGAVIVVGSAVLIGMPSWNARRAARSGPPSTPLPRLDSNQEPAG